MWRYYRHRHENHGVCVAIIAVLFVFGCECSPRSGVGRAVPHEEACNRRLSCVWKAIDRYHTEKGHWPRNEKGPNGHEHSWRVVLAPYLFASRTNPTQESGTFDYRFGEPWNSPHNLKTVASAGLAIELACPSESEWSDFPFTSYLWLVRPGTVDGANEELPPDAVLIIESAYSGIEIAEPRDISWDNLWAGESPFGRGKLKSLHRGMVKALRVDGRVIDIPKDRAQDDLLRLLNGSG